MNAAPVILVDMADASGQLALVAHLRRAWEEPLEVLDGLAALRGRAPTVAVTDRPALVGRLAPRCPVVVPPRVVPPRAGVFVANHPDAGSLGRQLRRALTYREVMASNSQAGLRTAPDTAVLGRLGRCLQRLRRLPLPPPAVHLPTRIRLARPPAVAVG